MTRFAIAAAPAILTAASAASQEINYACTFAEGAGRGDIGPQVMIAHEAGARRARVVDDIIMEARDGVPVRARATDRGDRLTFRWNVVDLRNSQGQLAPRRAYSLVIDRTSGAALARMQPARFRHDMSARGRCTVFE